MKIEGLEPRVPHNSHKNVSIQPAVKNKEAIAKSKEFIHQINKIKNRETTIHINSNVNHEIIKNYAEYYFKQGRQLEETKSYKQALNAYERSNVVQPDINKAKSVIDVRNKEFKPR